MEFWMVVAQQQVPPGEAGKSAQQAGEGASQIGQSIADLFSMAAGSQYGWIIGAFILFLIVRWLWRRVAG